MDLASDHLCIEHQFQGHGYPFENNYLTIQTKFFLAHQLVHTTNLASIPVLCVHNNRRLSPIFIGLDKLLKQELAFFASSWVMDALVAPLTMI